MRKKVFFNDRKYLKVFKINNMFWKDFELQKKIQYSREQKWDFSGCLRVRSTFQLSIFAGYNIIVYSPTI